MGNLIPWPDKAQRPPSRPHADGETMGQILFFMGVRYERHTPEDSSRPSGKSASHNRRKRRRA